MNKSKIWILFRKLVSSVLLITVTAMCLSCAANNRELLDKDRISRESNESSKPIKIPRSINASLKEGGYVFYKFEMKVEQDTIVSRGWKFNAAHTDSLYVDKIPLNEVEKFTLAEEGGEFLGVDKIMFATAIIFVSLVVISANMKPLILDL